MLISPIGRGTVYCIVEHLFDNYIKQEIKMQQKFCERVAVLTITYERRNANALNYHTIPGRAGSKTGVPLLQLGRGNMPAAGNALPAAVIPHTH